MRIAPLPHVLAIVSYLALGACGAAAPTYVTASAAPTERTLTVSGSARLELLPDEACIELTLAARDPAMPAAHGRLARDLDALLAALRADATLRVERGAVRYAPTYESDALGRSRLTGHVATAQVNVRTADFERIPTVVGVAAGHGLDRVEVVYYATDLVARKAEVRRHALEAARAKAESMAETAGVALGEVITVQEGGTSTFARPEAANYVAVAADSVSAAPPVPGTIPLTTDVTVVYRLR